MKSRESRTSDPAIVNNVNIDYEYQISLLIIGWPFTSEGVLY